MWKTNQQHLLIPKAPIKDYRLHKNYRISVKSKHNFSLVLKIPPLHTLHLQSCSLGKSAQYGKSTLEPQEARLYTRRSLSSALVSYPCFSQCEHVRHFVLPKASASTTTNPSLHYSLLALPQVWLRPARASGCGSSPQVWPPTLRLSLPRPSPRPPPR